MGKEHSLIPDIAVVLILVIVVIIGYNMVFNPLVRDFLGFGNSTNDASAYNQRNSTDVFFFDNFASEVERCSNGKDNDCYCTLINTVTPNGYVIRLRNINNNGFVQLLKGPSVSSWSCTMDNEPNPSAEKILKLAFYMEDVYGKADIYEENGITKLKINQFTEARDILFYGKEICSTKDVKGNDNINFNDGILYKFDDKSLGLTRKQEGLKPCNLELKEAIKDNTPTSNNDIGETKNGQAIIENRHFIKEP